MKKKTVTMLLALTLAASFCLTGCGDNGTPVQTTESSETVSDETAEAGDTAEKGEAADTENEADTDKKAADEVAALIDAIYVQERTDETDAQCTKAKEAWDALTDEQKALVNEPSLMVVTLFSLSSEQALCVVQSMVQATKA